MILIKTERMREVTIEGDKARAEAGAVAEDVGKAAIKDGKCSMPGTSPNVGVVGYTLGGGLSWLGRKHGWACNRVTAIELVTADGEARTVDAASDPDLFWALRGGGGGYAIVTALHVELLPIAEAYAGALLFPAEAGVGGGAPLPGLGRDRVRRRSAAWCGSSSLPPIPDVPEPLRGKKLLGIAAACIGSKEEGEKVIAPLREIGEPVMDTFDQIPAPGLSRIAMDPEPPVPAPRPSRACSASSTTRRSMPSTRPRGPSPARRCCSRSSASSVARSAVPPRTAARSTSSTPSW